MTNQGKSRFALKSKKPRKHEVYWRWEAELNRCKRICSPRPNRSAIPPKRILIGSGGWIRTSDLLINSQLRYHCATPEQSSGAYYIIIFACRTRGFFKKFSTSKLLGFSTGG